MNEARVCGSSLVLVRKTIANNAGRARDRARDTRRGEVPWIDGSDPIAQYKMVGYIQFRNYVIARLRYSVSAVSRST